MPVYYRIGPWEQDRIVRKRQENLEQQMDALDLTNEEITAYEKLQLKLEEQSNRDYFGNLYHWAKGK